MEKLTASDLDLFRKGIRKIIDREHRVDLYPVYGCLHHIDLTCFATVHVNSKYPEQVSIIIIKSKTIDEEDLEKMVSDKVNGETNFGRWMDHSISIDDGNFNSVICWVKDVNDTALSALRNILKTSTSKEVVLAAMQHDVIRHLHEGDYMSITTVADLKSELLYVPCPKGYMLKQMTMADAKYALSHWKSEKSGKLHLHMLASVINGMAIGAYSLQSNDLVSWVFGNWDGALSGLGTVKEHRGKGLAKSVISELAQIHLRKGMPVFAFIRKGVSTTPISNSLFLKLGFKLWKETPFHWAKF